MVYDVFVVANSWIAIGYGSSMTNTDMVWWSNGGETNLQQTDLYGTGHVTPSVDPVNAYTTTMSFNTTDSSATFVSTRPLNVNSGNETFVIQLDTPIDMIMAYNPNTNVL